MYAYKFHAQKLQDDHGWLQNSSLTISIINNSTDGTTTVLLTDIELQECHWNISKLNVKVLTSVLPNMSLSITGDDKNMSLVLLHNSSVQHLQGTAINLKILDSFFRIYTVSPESPLFVLTRSTVEVRHSVFQGVLTQNSEFDYNMYPMELDAEFTIDDNTQYTAAFFDIREQSRINLLQCNFERIGLDLSLDLTAALWVVSSQVIIDECVFSKNVAKWSTIYAAGSLIKVSNSTFFENTGLFGASLDIQQSSKACIANTTFDLNKATYGSVIAGRLQVNISVESSTFSRNSALHGASINVQRNSKLEVHNSTVSGNFQSAAVLAGENVLAIFRNCLFINNSVNIQNPAKGACISVLQNARLVVRNTKFTHNSAVSAGSAISTSGSLVHVYDSTFFNNSGQDGGCLGVAKSTVFLENVTFLANTAQVGGAIFCSEIELSTINLKDSKFEANIANTKGGGAIFVQGRGNLTADNCLFIRNKASVGVFDQPANNKTPNQAKSLFAREKTLQSEGGAIHFFGNGSLLLAFCQFDGNSAGYAGALSLTDTKCYITSCKFTRNNAQNGGSIYVDHNNAKVSMMNSTFQKNWASNGAGVIGAVNGATVNITSCLFSENNAYFAGTLAIQRAKMTLTGSHFLRNKAGKQAAVLDAINSAISVTSSNLSGNEAQWGTAFHVEISNFMLAKSKFSGHRSNIMTFTSSGIDISYCSFIKNQLLNSSAHGLVVINGQSEIKFQNCDFMGNEISSIIDVQPGSITSISHCTFANNLAIGNTGIIGNSRSSMHISHCVIGNNTYKGGGGVVNTQFGNITFFKNDICNNTVDQLGLIVFNGIAGCNLKIIECTFTENDAKNQSSIIYAQLAVDIVIDSSTFTRNRFSSNHLFLLMSVVSFRASYCNFEGKHSILYFVGDPRHPFTDFLTYNTVFKVGNVTLNSSSPDFLQSAERSGVIDVNDSPDIFYRETPYASGKNIRLMFSLPIEHKYFTHQ